MTQEVISLKCPDGHRVEQGHVLGPLDGQLAAGVEVDDLRHAVEGTAVLTKDVLVLLSPRQLHMHEALAAPAHGERGGQREFKFKSFIVRYTRGGGQRQRETERDRQTLAYSCVDRCKCFNILVSQFCSVSQ